MAYHLISIGISSYSNPSNNLDYPDEDAGEISAIIRHSLGANLTFDVLLRSNEATQIGIRTALASSELKAATANDTLILYYSGHGAVGKNSTSEAEAYLVPYDATGDITISGISTTEIKEALDSFPHGNKILLLDCCYSGGANSKGISNIKHKDLTSLKAFQNQTYAKGTFVFTACKEDETAIEVADLKHGLFTYHLIDELVKDRQETTIALSNIHDPVNNAVEHAAKEYHHTQTPTILISAKGSMSIPKLAKPPALKPEITKVPTNPHEGTPIITAPRIDISDTQSQQLVNDTISLVENAPKSTLHQIAFRSTLGKILNTVREAYGDAPKQISTPEELAAQVTALEGKSYQLFATAAVVGLTSDATTLKWFNEEIANILLWKHGQAGVIAAIETSDVIFLAILYILFICCIYTNDFTPVGKLLNTSIPDWDHRGEYIKVIQEHDIHYADALGGNAKAVLAHMLDLLKSQKWLTELLGVSEAKLHDLILQANLCLVVTASFAGGRTYPGYNDYGLMGISALAHHIKTDPDTQKSMASIFEVEASEVPGIFAKEIKYLNENSGGHWWELVSPEAFIEKDTSEIQQI